MQLCPFTYIALAAVLATATSVVGHPSVVDGVAKVKARQVDDDCGNNIALQFVDSAGDNFGACEDVVYETYLTLDRPNDFSYCTQQLYDCAGVAVCHREFRSCDVGEQYCDELHGSFTCIN